MRALFAALLFALFGAASASAQTLQLDAYAMGISPSEVDAISPGALQFDAPRRDGWRSARGRARLFGVDFTMAAGFDWNTGMRTIGLHHRGGESEPECRALAAVSAAAMECAFGLSPAVLPEARHQWTADARSYNDADRNAWQVDWFASWLPYGPDYCFIAIRASTAPILLSEPMIAELSDAEDLAGPPIWLAAPTPEQVRRAHPLRAAERNIGGVVVLACRVRVSGGGLRCMLEDERPSGWGLADAAFDLAEIYRIAPEVGGAPSAGRKLRLVIDLTDVPRRETRMLE